VKRGKLMHHRSRLLLALVAAAGTLALAVATASAGRIAFSNNHIRITWGALRFDENWARCRVTLEGSFHSMTLRKVARALIGYITRAFIKPCEVGSAWFLTGAEGQAETLPWHMRYDSFTGTLPRIERLRLQIVGFSYKYTHLMAGEYCLFRSTEAAPAVVDIMLIGNPTGLVKIAEERPIPLVPEASEAFCLEETGIANGSGQFFLLGTTTFISVTLI
jgi:hypothetical protein